MPSTSPPPAPILSSSHVYLPAPTPPPLPSSPSPSTASYHIFFIPGNPGCIGFYHAFLSTLSDHLRVAAKLKKTRPGVSIYGTSLANFTAGTETAGAGGPGSAAGGSRGGVIGLRGQIEYVGDRLERYVSDLVGRGDGGGEVRVIVMGHSVGAYIGLEVMRRWREKTVARRQREGRQERRQGAGEGEEDEQKGKGLFRNVGFVGLWPTVTWILKSPSGRRIGWLLRLPFFAAAVSTLARLLTSLLSLKWLLMLVKAVTRTPDDAAKVIANFLRERLAVKQALTMARDEMNQINEDAWDEDIWGAAAPSAVGPPRPKLVFYFGKEDHWVAEHTRDELIAARGAGKGKGSPEDEEKWRPKMLIDDLGIPHSFCIRHSAVAAEKAAKWVEEMIDADANADD